MEAIATQFVTTPRLAINGTWLHATTNTCPEQILTNSHQNRWFITFVRCFYKLLQLDKLRLEWNNISNSCPKNLCFYHFKLIKKFSRESLFKTFVLRIDLVDFNEVIWMNIIEIYIQMKKPSIVTHQEIESQSTESVLVVLHIYLLLQGIYGK